MVCTYTLMRGRGFRITPFGAKKLAGVSGVFLTGMLGYCFGSTFAMSALGSEDQYNYLMQNKRSIVSGDAPLDRPQEQ